MAPVFALRTTRWERFPLPPGEGRFHMPGHRWLRWAKLGRRTQKCPSVEYAKLFAYLAGKAIFRRRARANRRGILDAMNREHGYTLMETR